jgi:integrase
VKSRLGPPKSKQGIRDVPLDPALVLALREHRGGSEWGEEEHPVFAAGNGSPVLPSNVFGRVLKPAAEEAGVPWVGFHTFRHACAALLFAEGRNAKQVQRWLGHHSAAFTLSTYVHLLDDGIGEGLVIAHGAHKMQPSPTPISTNGRNGSHPDLALESGSSDSTPAHTAARGHYDSAVLTD